MNININKKTYINLDILHLLLIIAIFLLICFIGYSFYMQFKENNFCKNLNMGYIGNGFCIEYYNDGVEYHEIIYVKGKMLLNRLSS